MDLYRTLGLSLETHRVITLVGGGGKTTLLYALAREALGAGKRVIVTTTTHMWPHPRLEQASGPNRVESILQVGVLGPLGKLSPGMSVAQCSRLADVVLVEGDGAKGHPLKAPGPEEPVIPPESEAVLAVAGLTCLGQTIAQCCHRPVQVAALLGKGETAILELTDVAKLLASDRGGCKGVGAGVAYRCALNQADTPARRAAGEALRRLLAEQGIWAGVTAFLPEERGGLCWF